MLGVKELMFSTNDIHLDQFYTLFCFSCIPNLVTTSTESGGKIKQNFSSQKSLANLR